MDACVAEGSAGNGSARVRSIDEAPDRGHGEVRGGKVGERALAGRADRGAGGRDDDSVTHGGVSLSGGVRRTGPSRAQAIVPGSAPGTRVRIQAGSSRTASV